MGLLESRRSRLELLGTISQILSEGPLNMHQIFKRSNKTSWTVLYRLLPLMEQTGLVTKNPKREYALTGKGHEFLQDYLRLKACLEKVIK